MIHTQKQLWNSLTRYLIFDTDGGSVQLNLYSEKQDCGGTAFIYNLWVDENRRNKGIAERLLDTAERIAHDEGHKCVTLDYDIKDTPAEIYHWYNRRGYKVEYAQMTKDL